MRSWEASLRCAAAMVSSSPPRVERVLNVVNKVEGSQTEKEVGCGGANGVGLNRGGHSFYA